MIGAPPLCSWPIAPVCTTTVEDWPLPLLLKAMLARKVRAVGPVAAPIAFEAGATMK
jgi:hypothetical protein